MTTAWLLALAADQAAAVSPVSAASPVSPAFSGPVGQLAAAGPSWWRIVALLVVLGLLLFVWWKVNRGRFGTNLGLGLDRLLKPAGQRLVLGEQRWLNGRTVVCVVEIDGERFLLAQTQGALAWQPLPKAGAAAPKAP